MKTVKKNVYYCGFCKKHGLMRYIILEHEKHCTANPNRECRMCGTKGLEPKFKIQKIDRGYDDEEGVIVEDDDCPACALAFIRQNKTMGFTKEKYSWNFKKALNDYWEAQKDQDQLDELQVE